MTTIFDYIATMEAAAVDNPTGDGVCIMALPTGAGTATCGVVGLVTLLAPVVEASGDWAPNAKVALPVLGSTGTTDGYRPAWGTPELTALTASGAGHVLIESQALLPPLYAVGSTGAIASNALPSWSAYGLDGSFSRTATGAMTLPALADEAYVCGLDKPIANGATSAAVVRLLQQGSITIADAAASICAGLTDQDVMARAIIRYVADLLTYTSDGDGIGDTWMCAVATLRKEHGDCEDGSILAHSLMLAAGIDPGRIRTAFGTVLTTALVETGHAWGMYRRTTDEEWIPLDWTRGASTYAGALTTIKRQVDVTDAYTAISYILTDERFYAVNDADYISKLEANRSTGDMALPVPTAAGTISLSALGAMTLFKGTLGLTMTASGRCGARAAMTLPNAAMAATGKQANATTGEMVLPAPSVVARTGAHADCALPVFAISGGAGGGGHASFKLPHLAIVASAVSELLADASLKLPKPTVAARAGVGGLCDGACDLPLPRGYGRAVQGPAARVLVDLPHLVVVGAASPLSEAMADLSLPIPAMRGHAIPAAPWAHDLVYDSTRWT